MLLFFYTINTGDRRQENTENKAIGKVAIINSGN